MSKRRLTPEDDQRIAELYSGGQILKDIAAQFGVCVATAHLARNRHNARRGSARAIKHRTPKTTAELGSDLHKLEVLQEQLFAIVEGGALTPADWQKVSMSLIATTDSIAKHRALLSQAEPDAGDNDDAGERVRAKLKRLADGASVALVGVEAEKPGAEAVNE